LAASIVLVVAALALAIVGITINCWFARSLGSTEIAGWLFLAIGVAADLAALWRCRHVPLPPDRRASGVRRRPGRCG
jgi:hypothetical protein